MCRCWYPFGRNIGGPIARAGDAVGLRAYLKKRAQGSGFDVKASWRRELWPFWFEFAAKCLGFCRAGCIGGGVYYGAKQRAESQHPSPIVDNQARTQRASADALQLLSELRARFESSQSVAPNETSEGAEPSSPLLPGLADKFETDAKGYFPHFAATLGQADARVLLPARANAPFEMEDLGTGIKVEAKLDDVRDTAAEIADGYAVYKRAHASGATLLRRAMPNGSEDYLSFAESPTDPHISYSVKLGQGVAGLRLVSNTLEFLDMNGAPRLRVAPPYIVSADGNWLEAKLDVEGCAIDRDASAPWQRAVTEHRRAVVQTSCYVGR